VTMAAYAPKWRRLPAIAALVAAGGLLGFDVAPAMAAGNAFGFPAAGWELPSGAADFLQRHNIADRMFNNYETGGYLVWRLWPMQRDFIDPRGLSEEGYEDYKRILMNAGDLEKYGIQMLVVESFDYLSGQVYPLVAELAKPEQAA